MDRVDPISSCPFRRTATWLTVGGKRVSRTRLESPHGRRGRHPAMELLDFADAEGQSRRAGSLTSTWLAFGRRPANRTPRPMAMPLRRCRAHPSIASACDFGGPAAKLPDDATRDVRWQALPTMSPNNAPRDARAATALRASRRASAGRLTTLTGQGGDIWPPPRPCSRDEGAAAHEGPAPVNPERRRSEPESAGLRSWRGRRGRERPRGSARRPGRARPARTTARA